MSESAGGWGRLAAAIGAALVCFVVAGVAIFYAVAGWDAAGWRLSGPTALAGEMAGLFGGGLAAVVVLIAVLRWGRGGRS